MKRQFQIKTYKSGMLNSALMDIISKHNENPESYPIDLEDIHGYVKCRRTELPTSLQKMITEIVMDELIIMEDGKNVTMIVEEKVIVELKEEEVEAI